MLFLRYYLWIAPQVVLVAFLWLFLRRDLQRRHPFFLVYLLLELASFLSSVIAVVLVARGPTHATHATNLYRWSMVGFQGIISLVSFGVIYELANQLIMARSVLAQTLRPVLRWSVAVLLLLTAAATAGLGVTAQRVANVFQALDFSSSVLQVGLLAVLLLFSRVLRISWRSLPVGIAVGLGIDGCAELSAAGLFSVLNVGHYVAIDATRMAAFHVSVLVWMGYLVFPDHRPKFGGGPPQTSDLESWDQDLQKMVRR